MNCYVIRSRIKSPIFFTSYHEVHNAYGRGTINYCGKEVAAFTWLDQYTQMNDILAQYRKMKNVPKAYEDYRGSIRAYESAYEIVSNEKWMSEKGNCLDNAVMENFFGHLKSELLYLQDFDSIEHFQTEFIEYLDYYNTRRIKVKFKGLTPAQHRSQALRTA